MNKLAVIGAGEFGKQVLRGVLAQGKYQPIGFYDDFCSDDSFCGIPVLGKIEAIEEDYQKEKFDFLFVAIGYNHLLFKQQLIHKFSQIPMATVIDPSVLIDETATIEQGVFIYPKAYIGPNTRLQKGTVINIGTHLPHDNFVGECSFLSVGINMGGKVNFGERCFVGVGTTISDSLSIGNDIKIGAGTLIIKDMDEPGTYVGSPARKLYSND